MYLKRFSIILTIILAISLISGITLFSFENRISLETVIDSVYADDGTVYFLEQNGDSCSIYHTDTKGNLIEKITDEKFSGNVLSLKYSDGELFISNGTDTISKCDFKSDKLREEVVLENSTKFDYTVKDGWFDIAYTDNGTVKKDTVNQRFCEKDTVDVCNVDDTGYKEIFLDNYGNTYALTDNSELVKFNNTDSYTTIYPYGNSNKVSSVSYDGDERIYFVDLNNKSLFYYDIFRETFYNADNIFLSRLDEYNKSIENEYNWTNLKNISFNENGNFVCSADNYNGGYVLGLCNYGQFSVIDKIDCNYSLFRISGYTSLFFVALSLIALIVYYLVFRYVPFILRFIIVSVTASVIVVSAAFFGMKSYFTDYFNNALNDKLLYIAVDIASKIDDSNSIIDIEEDYFCTIYSDNIEADDISYTAEEVVKYIFENGERQIISDFYMMQECNSVYYPVFDSDGLVVCVLRVSALSNQVAQQVSQAVNENIFKILILALILILVNLVIALLFLAQVKKLKKCSEEVVKGNYGTTLQPKGDNELTALSVQFNSISLGMAEDMSELKKLNQYYGYYVPEKIISLFGSDISVGKSKKISLAVLYVNLEMKHEVNVFNDFIKQVIDNLNGGIVEYYNDKEIKILYDTNYYNAVKDAVYISQIKDRDIKVKLFVDFENCNFKIIGNRNRPAIVSESKQIIDWSEIYGIVFTERLAEKVPELRKISRFTGVKDSVRMYEFLDSDKKKKFKDKFEKAVNLYSIGNYRDARSLFAEIIKKYPDDRISANYLCDIKRNGEE